MLFSLNTVAVHTITVIYLFIIFNKIIIANLTTTQRIGILIYFVCGNLTKSQQEICNMFNAKYPDLGPKHSFFFCFLVLINMKVIN